LLHKGAAHLAAETTFPARAHAPTQFDFHFCYPQVGMENPGRVGSYPTAGTNRVGARSANLYGNLGLPILMKPSSLVRCEMALCYPWGTSGERADCLRSVASQKVVVISTTLPHRTTRGSSRKPVPGQRTKSRRRHPVTPRPVTPLMRMPEVTRVQRQLWMRRTREQVIKLPSFGIIRQLPLDTHPAQPASGIGSLTLRTKGRPKLSVPPRVNSVPTHKLTTRPFTGPRPTRCARRGRVRAAPWSTSVGPSS